MKKILIILFLIIPFCVNAQTDKDILSEIVKQQAKVAEQQIEINKQILETIISLVLFNKSPTSKILFLKWSGM